jgi:hypothetical protein
LKHSSDIIVPNRMPMLPLEKILVWGTLACFLSSSRKSRKVKKL